MFSLKFKAPPVLISCTLPKIVKSKKSLMGRITFVASDLALKAISQGFVFVFACLVCFFFFFLLHKNLFTQPEDLCVCMSV